MSHERLAAVLCSIFEIQLDAGATELPVSQAEWDLFARHLGVEKVTRHDGFLVLAFRDVPLVVKP